MSDKNKAWDGRFEEANDPVFESMNRSLAYDIRMYKEDIQLNVAWSRELARLGVLTEKEFSSIVKGLAELEVQINEKGIELFDKSTEDIHMGIEALLATKIGDTAKKIHFGKSRNDQVATDQRLYTLRSIDELLSLLQSVMKSIYTLASENNGVMMPGFTHLRQAQPLQLSHWLMSWFFLLERDAQRLKDTLPRISIMPLGSAALSGTTLAVNRESLRKELGFAKISDNSMDGVSSRDFMLELMSTIAILSGNLSRMAEDMILYSSEQFGYFELSDKVSTGSSIMPNKKNPDSLELIRAKAGRLLGNYTALFTVIKALPSTYNKDLQEDKERLFDSLDTIKQVLHVTQTTLSTLSVNKSAMQKSIDPLSFATELADYLSAMKMPFREAHKITGKIVLDCIKEQKVLTEMTETDLLKYSPQFGGIGNDWASHELFLAKRDVYGGTGTSSVDRQLERAANVLDTLF
jgi:argininosuccinate lyase